MKRNLLIAALAIAAMVALSSYRRDQAARAEAELWSTALAD